MIRAQRTRACQPDQGDRKPEPKEGAERNDDALTPGLLRDDDVRDAGGQDRIAAKAVRNGHHVRRGGMGDGHDPDEQHDRGRIVDEGGQAGRQDRQS